MKKTMFFALCAFALTSCNSGSNKSDASGSFEAEETIISAEASGTIKQFIAQEGQEIKSGEQLGYIDTIQLYLKKKQLEAQIQSVLSQRPNISAQTAALEAQLETAQREQQRVSKLVKADAATQKQLDDINSQIYVLKKQIEAQQSALGITTEGITEQTSPLKVQIEQINDQLIKSKIINPITGTILTKYAEENEVVMQGKALYKVADLSYLTLRAYVTGGQLSQIKLNQQAKVLVDNGEKDYKEYTGTIYWISDKSEFTPKTIQTKEERANLVYAIKLRVKNDGYLKIGMYGEVHLAND